jgi:hypothetical protein
MMFLNKWTRKGGDGGEKAIEYEDGKFWVPLDEVNNFPDAMRWIVKVGETSWATKADVINLASMLFDHIDAIRQRKDDQEAARRERAHSDTIRALGAVTKLAARLGAGKDTLEKVKVGATWGAWSYKDDGPRGPRLSYGAAGYPIGLSQLTTPEAVSTVAQHLADKEWDGEQDLSDAVEALVNCFAGAGIASGREGGS